MRITSKKSFIEKVKEGYKLEKLREFKRILWYLTNYKDTEITVSISLIRKLQEEGIIDSNWQIRLK